MSETAQRIIAKRRQRHAMRRWRTWLLRGALLLCLLLGIGAGSLYAFERYFATRIYPNVSIHGVAVGQLTSNEATAAVYEHYADFIRSPVTLRYDDQSWTPSLSDLGMHLDIDTAVQQARTLGRHPERLQTLRTVAAIGMQGYDLPLKLHIDQTTMQHYLLTHLEEVEQPAVDAHLSIEAAQPLITPAAPGRQVLIDATMNDIVATVQSLQPQVLQIRTRALAPLFGDTRATEAQQDVATLLQAPITLTAGEGVWEWSPTDLARFVRVERVPAEEGPGDRLVVSVDESLVRQHVQNIANATEVGGVYPRVNWSGGSLTIFRSGVPGARVDEEQATAMIMDAFWSSERHLALPFQDVPVPSSSADLAGLGINELISVGRTSFEDSEDYRVTNIVAGMRLLHGILLAPGEEFSFNETIGAINAANGFVKGYAIVDEETQLEWGGGICQDSTTMMRAAFWAGLPFTERWNHSRYISWYDAYGYGPYGDGPGIDSTIFLGGPDLRFVNDTGAWILMQAYTNTQAEIAEIRFYGTKGGRTVEFVGPNIDYMPNGGMDVSFTRIIKENGVETRRATYWSTYDPW
jgi:vancomycin resistance protein YoaR